MGDFSYLSASFHFVLRFRVRKYLTSWYPCLFDLMLRCIYSYYCNVVTVMNQTNKLLLLVLELSYRCMVILFAAVRSCHLANVHEILNGEIMDAYKTVYK